MLFTKLLIPDALYTTGEAAAIALLALYFVQRFAITPGPLGVYLTIAGLIGGAMSFLAPRMAQRWAKVAHSDHLTVPHDSGRARDGLVESLRARLHR